MLGKIYNTHLEDYKNRFQVILKDKKSIIFVILLIIIFIIIMFFVYNNFIKNFINDKHSLNREFVKKSSNNNDVLILYFYTQWCPYCKQSMPEIKKFEDYVNGLNGENSYKITVTKIDCDENTTMANKYKIQGYPTIKLIYKGKVYDYDAKPTKENLIQFLETTVKK